VVVVEHDEAIMRAADWLIDFGPTAGIGGGRVMAAGTPAEVEQSPESVTAKYLRGEVESQKLPARRKVLRSKMITLSGASHNNLKQVEVEFPLGLLVCVTGVSGSGKSTLVNDTLARAAARRMGLKTDDPGPYESLRGLNHIDKFVQIDQAASGRSPRSNAATYTGLFDEIRKVFANSREAKQLGYNASRFSFNVKGGRCETCQGQGLQKIEMNFLPDLFVTCEDCGGQRFNEQTLAVKYRGASIADCLAMSVDEALVFFEHFTNIGRLLQSMERVGLGYLPLGQPSTTLSGGESQRVKLATELARVDTGNTLYLLDEPTTGLHFDDVRRLIQVLSDLVDKGNSVIVIEHHLDVMRAADWLIDLGPEGGSQGGEVLVVGTPEEVARSETHTGRYLRGVM
jgi:excinuclease ABC subunit A